MTAKKEFTVVKRWTAQEEIALKAGIAKHGAGAWVRIREDPEYSHLLKRRTGMQLKDKWRNLIKFGHISAEEGREAESRARDPAKLRQGVRACLNCGALVHANAKACGGCGGSLEVEGATAALDDSSQQFQHQQQQRLPTSAAAVNDDATMGNTVVVAEDANLERQLSVYSDCEHQKHAASALRHQQRHHSVRQQQRSAPKLSSKRTFNGEEGFAGESGDPKRARQKGGGAGASASHRNQSQSQHFDIGARPMVEDRTRANVWYQGRVLRATATTVTITFPGWKEGAAETLARSSPRLNPPVPAPESSKGAKKAWRYIGNGAWSVRDGKKKPTSTENVPSAPTPPSPAAEVAAAVALSVPADPLADWLEKHNRLLEHRQTSRISYTSKSGSICSGGAVLPFAVAGPAAAGGGGGNSSPSMSVRAGVSSDGYGVCSDSAGEVSKAQSTEFCESDREEEQIVYDYADLGDEGSELGVSVAALAAGCSECALIGPKKTPEVSEGAPSLAGVAPPPPTLTDIFRAAAGAVDVATLAAARSCDTIVSS